MREVGRSAYLMHLPVDVDEYTEIDTWESLRTQLHSTAHRSAAAKLQRIRAKPATHNHVAKNDPVLYADSSQGSVRTAKFRGEY
jgi:hypothetical protein